MNWTDFAVIAIMLVSIFAGMKRGLVRSILGVSSIIISLILAVWTYPVVSDFIQNSKVNDVIEQNVSGAIGASSPSQAVPKVTLEPSDDRFADLPQSAQKAITDGVDKITGSVIDSVSGSVSTLSVNILSILIVFIIVRFFMFLLTHSVDFLTKLPVIKSVNLVLGGVLGAACGIITVYLIMTLLTVNTVVSSFESITYDVRESKIASKMYDNNFILNYIAKK